MRREIIATRRAGVTTSVVTEIALKGVHRMLAHDWQDGSTSTLTKKIRSSWANANKKLSNFEKLEPRIIVEAVNVLTLFDENAYAVNFKYKLIDSDSSGNFKIYFSQEGAQIS
jgi:hypothetical protein